MCIIFRRRLIGNLRKTVKFDTRQIIRCHKFLPRQLNRLIHLCSHEQFLLLLRHSQKAALRFIHLHREKRVRVLLHSFEQTLLLAIDKVVSRFSRFLLMTQLQFQSFILPVDSVQFLGYQVFLQGHVCCFVDDVSLLSNFVFSLSQLAFKKFHLETQLFYFSKPGLVNHRRCDFSF